jgi:hypothetical protein
LPINVYGRPSQLKFVILLVVVLLVLKKLSKEEEEALVLLAAAGRDRSAKIGGTLSAPIAARTNTNAHNTARRVN